MSDELYAVWRNIKPGPHYAPYEISALKAEVVRLRSENAKLRLPSQAGDWNVSGNAKNTDTSSGSVKKTAEIEHVVVLPPQDGEGRVAAELHPATTDLLDRFAAELKSKLAKAEAKYGYAADWLNPDWQSELIESLSEHIQKGDPRDVAAYCAFAWHHGWSVSGAVDFFARPFSPHTENGPAATPPTDPRLDRAIEALEKARAALHQHYVDWDGEPEDAVPLQLARSECDQALASIRGEA